MTEPSATAVPDQGLFARVIGIITAPGQTFKAIVAYPRPAGILLLVCLALSLAATVPQLTDRGRQAMLELQVQQTEKITGQPVTDDQYQRMEQFAKYQAYISAVGIFVIVPVVSLILTALYWAVFNTILGGTASFKQVLGIMTHSQVVSALGALLGAPIQYAKGVFTSTGPFNLGALAPMLEPDSLAATILSSIGIFQLWGIVVTAIGLGVLYKRKSTGIAIALTAIYLVFVVGFSMVFSRMGR